MHAIGIAFRQLMATFTMFFAAFERTGSGINNVATWFDESTGAFVDEARINRQKNLALLNGDLVATEKQVRLASKA